MFQDFGINCIEHIHCLQTIKKWIELHFWLTNLATFSTIYRVVPWPNLEALHKLSSRFELNRGKRLRLTYWTFKFNLAYHNLNRGWAISAHYCSTLTFWSSCEFLSIRRILKSIVSFPHCNSSKEISAVGLFNTGVCKKIFPSWSLVWAISHILGLSMR